MEGTSLQASNALTFKERSIAMVFNETTNYDFILHIKQDRTQLIFFGGQIGCSLMLHLITEHVFGKFEGISRIPSP